jgi:hypothetical protein
MAITVNWENDEKTIISICYEQPWTWEEFEQGHRELQHLLTTSPHKVDVIFDVVNGGPLKPNAISRFRDAAKTRNPNQGAIVFVGANIMVQTIVQTIGKLTRTQTGGMQFASTREEAKALLKKLS